MFKFLLFRSCHYLANRFPVKLSYKIANFISDLLYIFCFRDRQSVMSNLKVILPASQNWSKLTREVFHNFGIYMLEFFRMEQTLTEEYLKNNVKVENIHFFHDVLKQGKGAIVLTAHIGNWELGAAIMARLGFPLVVIALPHIYKPVNDFFNRQREVHGIKIVPTNIMVRRCIENLQANEFVAIAADRDFGSSGQIVNFLGRKTLLPKGAAIFSEKIGSPIIPVFLIRSADNQFTLKVKAPLYPPENKENLTKDEMTLKIMNQYIPFLEDIIREYPTQWTIFREFFIQ